MNTKFCCGFIGFGLIGASIAKAIKKSNASAELIAYDIDKSSLNHALLDGLIQKACDTIGSDFSCCDFIFLCAPVSKNNENLKLLKPFLKKDCILTDVGSVKGTIHKTITKLGLDEYFIGGHPMTGSEKTGYANSNHLLLENAYYILTPSEISSEKNITRYQNLVTSFGAIPLTIDYKKHDYITAAISHLPHIVASSLVHLVHDLDDSNELMKQIAAGGFKDLTRIASSSPAMWQSICLANTDNITDVLRKYIDYLQKTVTLLEDSNASFDKNNDIYSFFESAKNYRDTFTSASIGPIKNNYFIHLEVPDETGIIAKTATILAKASINIKNIGILHNREFEEGALLIEFYEESAKMSAIHLLEYNEYKIYS